MTETVACRRLTCTRRVLAVSTLALAASMGPLHAHQPAAAAPEAPRPALVLPLERTAYFTGETVPLAVSGAAALKLEAVGQGGRVPLYEGAAGNLWLDTTRLAPGDYALELNGQPVLPRLSISSPLRRSVASMQDEATPNPPQHDPKKATPAEYAAQVQQYWDSVATGITESGLTSVVALAQSDAGRFGYLDTLARSGAMLLANCDTRPTSFNPGTLMPEELDGMSQRMILTAQANARHPNFAGFCFAWDTCGYAIGGRRQLLIYWGWNDKTDALRSYIERVDRFKEEEFIRRTNLEPVSEKDYIAYLLSTGQAELVPQVDLPTKVWTDEMAKRAKPMPAAERAAFEQRLDAWSQYMMGMYGDVYGEYVRRLGAVDPALQYTGSVQIDHVSTRQGQYFPTAYAPLSLRYQSTWNDQVGGPDYQYQWLITQGLLDMERGNQVTWISNAIAAAHHRADYPGKFPRVAAHGLAYGASGIGFACEAFSNLFGGMNAATNWSGIKGKAGGADLLGGKDFLDRFAALAINGRARNGVGVLFSKSQYGRQGLVPAFGSAPFTAFVTLARLGRTPCFLTEDDITGDRMRDVPALLVLGQTVPLPAPVLAKLDAFTKAGGRLLCDGNTSVAIPGAEKLAYTFPLSAPGKPHNWGVPNMPAGENDVTCISRWLADFGPVLAKALGDTGRPLLAPEKGTASDVSVFTVQGGADATYLVAVNDSFVHSQADWYQVREQLLPLAGAPAAQLYDCTAEQALGPLAPLSCDLTATTARVYAALPRALGRTDLAALQKLKLGEDLPVSVSFGDADGKHLAAVLPFQVQLRGPGGQLCREFYRATGADGTFSMSIPLPATAPAGEWTLSVRSQLNGTMTRLPITVQAAAAAPAAQLAADTVFVREAEAIDDALVKGASFAVPIFASARRAELAAAAATLEKVLAKRGVKVEIWQEPTVGTYTLGYSLSAYQEAQNRRADEGLVIARIRRETVNHNDWFSGASGWRFGRPVILLDLVVPPPADPKAKPEADANPMAQALRGLGALWPRVTPAFPGPGKAVVQLVHWAFAPRTPAIVIQATDAAGLAAGVEALRKLPQDRLTPGIRAVKGELWRQHHVGGTPAAVAAGVLKTLTAKGAATDNAPQPFAITFYDTRPPAADQIKRAERAPAPGTAIPATFLPKDYTVFYRTGDQWTESATAGMLVPDLRFSQGIRLVLDVKQAGKTGITARGVFRYSDKQPCSQAQWEDYLALRRRLVTGPRQPMTMDVLLAGTSIGVLKPAKTTEMKVMTRWNPVPSEYQLEEVVTDLAGEVDLPAGRQEILLVHRNLIDGKLDMVGVGMEPVAPPAPAKK